MCDDGIGKGQRRAAAALVHRCPDGNAQHGAPRLVRGLRRMQMSGGGGSGGVPS